ncbi:UNVERIFIED_CONTAM: FxLYD domain-containing protein [Halobacillus marinus]
MKECPQCKQEMTENSRYCSHCGAALNQDGESQLINNSNKNKKRSWLPVVTPAVVLVVIGVALYFVYEQEKHVNEEVAAWKKKAENVALDGEYRQAETLLSKAIDQRPGNESLKAELKEVQVAVGLDKKLTEAEKQIEKEDLAKAKERLSAIQEKIQQNQSRVILTLVPRLNELNSTITLQEVNKELAKLSSVDELAAKLNTLSDLNLEETAKVREKIFEKIVNRSTKEAEAAMKEKQYTEAIALIDQGLQYVSNDDQLIQLKERIQKEKEAFEQAEQQRLEQAMQQAAEDELVNQTEALKVLSFDITKDEFGDYKVKGQLESVATQIISTVTVKYDILDKDGKVVRSESAKVYPTYINPGTKGSFEKVYYELEEGEYSVNMTEMEWMVE